MVSELDRFLLDLLVIAFGVFAILNGRRLTWLFVGIGGAVLGMILTTFLIPNQPEWLHILLIVALGGVSAWAAQFNVKISTWIAAFVLGGFVFHFLVINASPDSMRTTIDFVAVVVGGILGVALYVIYGPNAMIVISSFCGAALVVLPLQASDAFQAALFSGLAAVGMLLQSRAWIAKKAEREAASESMVGIEM